MTGLGYYVLDDNYQPHEVDTLEEFFAWLRKKQETGDHPRITLQTARDVVECKGRRITVSTVYLGCDHGWGFSDEPVLWETMVFGLSDDDEQERYTSHDEALAGHARWLASALALPDAIPVIAEKRSEALDCVAPVDLDGVCRG